MVAVSEAIIRLSILNRYQQMREEQGYSRLVVQSIHDEAYTGIPQTVRAVDELRFLDAITIHRWGGEVVYTNSLALQVRAMAGDDWVNCSQGTRTGAGSARPGCCPSTAPRTDRCTCSCTTGGRTPTLPCGLRRRARMPRRQRL